MELTKLAGDKIGKRMAAFAWAVYQVGQAEDFERALTIAGLTVAYMVLQTVSDRSKAVSPKAE